MSDFLDFVALQRSPKPNTHLLAPEGLCQTAKPDVPSPLFDEPPEALFARVCDVVSAMPRIFDVRRDDAALKLAFVAQTALLKFKDDIDIQVLAGEGGAPSQLAIYSRSRVGTSDLGTNRKRVAGIIGKLTSK